MITLSIEDVSNLSREIQGTETEICGDCDIQELPAKTKDRGIDERYLYKDKIRIWNGEKLLYEPGQQRDWHKYWHPTKNGNLVPPQNITNGSSKKIWLKCPDCNHAFETSPTNISRGSWCPYCCEPVQKICNNKNCEHCLNNSFASHPKSKYWHRTKNGDLIPRNIPKNSNKKHWFECPDCNHAFDMCCNSIIGESWCPYCSTPVKKLCISEDCNHCFNKSFARYDGKTLLGAKIVSCWSDINEKNPREVTQCSNMLVYIDCDMCPHTYDAYLNNIRRGDRCPYCSSHKRCSETTCEHCLNNSFASHPKSRYWHLTKNGNLTPRDIAKYNNNKRWMKCPDCKHDFDITPAHVNDGNWCPYCSNKNRCFDITCEHCLNNSFASCDRSKYWDPKKNGDVKPRDIAKHSAQKIYLICEARHEFESSAERVTNGVWCSKCCNKTEKKLFEFLKEQYPDDVKHQPKYNWCKNSKTNYSLPFDFEVFGSIIIELDGPQHIDKQISNWISPEEQQKRDIYKMEQSINNGKHIIRILQEDVWNDKNNWKEKLIQKILLLKDDTDTKIMCIGECDVYKEYKIEN